MLPGRWPRDSSSLRVDFWAHYGEHNQHASWLRKTKGAKMGSDGFKRPNIFGAFGAMKTSYDIGVHQGTTGFDLERASIPS